MAFPQDFLNLANFQLAWERVIRGSNAQYKRFHRHLIPSYNIAADSNLTDLISRLRKGIYLPSRAVTVYIPKPTRILRPITLLSLNDQVLYQGIANYIAGRFFKSLRPNYGVKAFGALYAGSQSPFFYRPWKKAYQQFNAAIKRSYSAGNKVLGDFDLVSFFDLIDHKILRKILERNVASGEVLDLLFDCLQEWTSGNPSAYIRGHGIPQGPEPSAFLAEIMLADFDRAGYRNVAYLRYVDDIKLLGKDFSPVRRALLRLDLQAKRLGLVPQAQKIEVRRITDINAELKSVPSSIAGATSPQKMLARSKSTIQRLQRLLRNSLSKRKGEVVVKKETHFKFALQRLPPSKRVLRLIEPLFHSRPDLSDILSRFASRFQRDRRVAKLLYRTLKTDPVFDAAGGDYVLALDRCAPLREPKKYKKIVSKLMNRSEEKSLLLDVARNLYTYKRTSKTYVVQSVKTEPSAISAGQLINLLVFDANHASLSARDLLPALRTFANRSTDEDLCRYCTYLMLSELRKRPHSPQLAGALLLQHLGWSSPAITTSLLTTFFRDLFGLTIRVDWGSLLGKRAHSEAQRRAILLRGRWAGNPSILITTLDSFNDLLLQRMSKKHKALKKPFLKAAGKNKIPDYGAWLKHPIVSKVLPKSSPILIGCHDLRVRADVAHATHKKSGRFTRPVSYNEKAKLLKTMKTAYNEFLTVCAAV
jgi:hypothetical protein